MSIKAKNLRYVFLIPAVVVVLICFGLYLWLFPTEDGNKIIIKESKLKEHRIKENSNGQRGPAIVPNPDDCEITLENGECASPGSF